MKVEFLFIRQERCTGCRVCEGVCSLAQEGVLNKSKSRIRIRREDVLALRQFVCDQCGERPCVASCPKGAIFEKEGQVRIRRSLCDGCGDCVKVCDKLFLLPGGRRAVMCNQCGACVEKCPEGALEMRERLC